MSQQSGPGDTSQGTSGLARLELVGEPVAYLFDMSARDFLEQIVLDPRGARLVDIEGRAHHLTPCDIGLLDEVGEWELIHNPKTIRGELVGDELLSESPCIEVVIGRDDIRLMTVAEYDEVQQLRYDQPLWARRVPAVEDLSVEPAASYGIRITSTERYAEQMRRLLGLTVEP